MSSPQVGRKIAFSIFALVFGMIGGLLFGEVALRIIYWHGMDFDLEMWKYATTVKRQSSNPQISHEHRPLTHSFLMGVDVQTNSEGFRDREFDLNKSPDTKRILVIGDSVTFGWGVSVENTYPKILERRLNNKNPSQKKYEVINTGVGNYNTAQEVALLKERGLKYKPDVIVLGFFINDPEPTQRYAGSFLKEHSYLFIFLKSYFDRNFKKLDGRSDYLKYYDSLFTDSNPGWPKCVEALKELDQICTSQNIHLFVALIPELHNLSDSYPFKTAYGRVSEVLGTTKAHVVDLLPYFKNTSPESSLWVTIEDAHPNAKAQEIIAQGIEDELTRFYHP